jgi:hypothetical protein
MTDTSLPSPELLRKLLRYEPETGMLFWKNRPREMFNSDITFHSFNRRFAGKEALAYVNKKYRVGKILGKKFLAHRVVWAIETGSWPVALIDHINQNTTDNRLNNLREATKRQNGANSRSRSKSSSKYLGVHWSKRDQNWRSQIRINGVKQWIGCFTSEREAALAYDHAAKKFHGEFASFNFPLKEGK